MRIPMTLEEVAHHARFVESALTCLFQRKLGTIMPDFVFILVTLLCFGVAHAYVLACDRLNGRRSND
jgi:hypothetical protein